MKKVLVIANIFHASPRIPGMISYLREFGWQPTFLTVPFDDKEAQRLALPKGFKDIDLFQVNYVGDIFFPLRWLLKVINFKKDKSDSFIETMKHYANAEVSKNFIENLAHQAHQILAYPDTEITWIIPAITKFNFKYNIKDFDCVLSSSPHPTSHIIASLLHGDIPWIADFRDPWTQNHVYPYNSIRRYFERKLELKVINEACFLTGATETMSKKQFNLHNKPYKIIYNGFDLDIFQEMPLTDKFTITYTGTIYDGKQMPDKFFAPLKYLINSGQIKDIEVRFYGRNIVKLQDRIDYWGLQHCVWQLGLLPRAEVLKRQSESYALLMFNWEDEEEKSVCPTKFFEYLATHRPILATGGTHGDEIENILNKTNAGYYVCGYFDIVMALTNLYKEYKAKRIGYSGDINEINKYSFKNMAKQFAEIFDNVSEQYKISKNIEAQSVINRVRIGDK